MPMIDRTDDELDPATMLGENDRIRPDAADERPIPRSRELQHAMPRRDGLIYRRQDDARRDSADYAAEPPAFDGNDGIGGDAGHVGEFDSYTMRLLEGLGDALGMTRIELRRDLDAADAKLLDRISDLQATSKNLEVRIGQLEQQLTTLATTRLASLEKDAEGLVKAMRRRTARITELEGKVKALNVAIAGEPSARDFDARIGYLETVLSIACPRSRV
jgi:hypothetical protein